MHLNIPGEYWLLHHILPESLLYVPSYLLADINVAGMHTYLENKYGNQWWKNKQAGKYIYELMKPGKDSLLADFSKANPQQFLKRIGC